MYEVLLQQWCGSEAIGQWNSQHFSSQLSTWKLSLVHPVYLNYVEITR